MSIEKINPPMRGGALVVRGSRSVKLLTEPVLFEEEALPSFVRVALFTVCGLVVAFIVWASLVHIDEVAVATGQVLPSGDIRVVQVLDGGTATQILANNGDRVDKGQVLVRMDPTQSLADLNQLQSHMVDLQLRAERLKAEVANRQPNFEAIGAGYPDKINDQRRLWAGQLASNHSALGVIDDQIAQRQHEIAQLEGQLVIAKQQLVITNDQVHIRDQGVQAGVVSREVYLETKRAQVTAVGEIDRIEKQLLLDQSTLSEYIGHKRNLAQTQTQDALAELGTISDDAGQMKDQLAKAQDRVDRLDIRAPVNGIIQDLRIHTIGEVVPAGGQMMSVVPLQDILIAQVRISPADIGHIAIGQPVKIKVASYEYTRYGMLQGEISKLSPSTLTDEQNHPYYAGEVTIPHPYFGDDSKQNQLLPGMSVETDIATGEKTLMEYLLKPVFVSLSDSFHER